jgi:hypothetical protein
MGNGLIKMVVKLRAHYLGKVIGALLALTLLALAYLHAVGFPSWLTSIVAGQLQRAGIAAQFGSVRLVLFRGVVATDVVLADAAKPETPLARIDELALHWNWGRLAHRRNAVDTIRVANARVAVPTPSDRVGMEFFTAENASAVLRFDEDGTIQLSELTGVYCGIKLRVRGTLKPRAASAAPAPSRPLPPTDKVVAQQFVAVTKVVRELNRLQQTFPLELAVNFAVDLGQPFATQQARAWLHGAGLQYRGVQADSVAVDVQLTNGVIEVQQCDLKLYGGTVTVTGRYDMVAGQFDLQMASTTDPTAFAPVLPMSAAAELRQLKLKRNPKIVMRLMLSPETGSLPQVQGSVETGGLEFRGVKFNSIQFAVTSKERELFFSDALVVTPEGRLTGHGQFHVESTDFAYEFDSTLDPTKLLPLMRPFMRRWVEPCWFETSPHVTAKVSGDFVDPDMFAYNATVTADRCSYRGVPLERASASLRLRRSKLDVRNLVLGRQDGELRGELTADFNAQRVSFNGHSTAAPAPMAPLLGEKAARTMEPYRFGSNTTARASGVVDFADPKQTAWTAQLANDGFTFWQFMADHGEATLAFENEVLKMQLAASGLAWWKLKADRATANLSVTGGVAQVEDFNADFYGGKLQGIATFTGVGTNAEYRAELVAERCDIHKMLESSRGKTSEASGWLTGNLELRGRGSDLAAMQGEGSMEIVDGLLAEVPLFGIFSQVLNSLAPGLGSTKVTSARCAYTIADQAVKTDDLIVDAGAFTLRAHGKAEFNGKLDFRVKLQFLRLLPGFNLLWDIIIGNIFEYKIGGALAEPNYRPVNLPSEIMPHGKIGGETPKENPPDKAPDRLTPNQPPAN